MADLKTPAITPQPHQRFADPPMLLRSARAGGFIRTNAAFRAQVGYDETVLAGEPLERWIHPADIKVALATIAAGKGSCRIHHRTQESGPLPMEMRVVEKGDETVVLARWKEQIEPPQDPDDAHDEATVSGTLHQIARIVEAQNPGYKCSILLVADGRFVRGAGPSLPEEYNAAIDGFAIGPTVGSCGTAIYWNVPVIVEDIQADPLWVPFSELAKKAGVAACWSHPFVSTTGNVLGALAFYAPVPCAPTQEQLGRLKAAAQMTGLAVERGRAEEALRAKRIRELELEEKLRQAAKMESMGTLAGGIAHDFNNLLNTILGFTELALHQVDKGTDLAENLQDVYTAGQRAKDLVKQILSFARQSDQKFRPIRIDSVLNEALKFITSSTPTNIQVRPDIDSDALIMGDATQIHQIFMNLFTNAIQAMEGSGGLLEVRLKEIGAEEVPDTYSSSPHKGEFVKIEVADSGVGIPEANLGTIFEPYFTTKPTGRGTGLGLATVYGNIETHGGKIWVDSTLGEGTTFTLIFPVSHQTRVHQSHAPEALVYGSEHVLVVDDEALIANMTGKVLEHLGYTVTSRTSSLEALELFRRKKNDIDLVMTDMTMPNMTGDQLAIELRNIRPDIPVILCTGYSHKVTEESIARAGIKALVHKPIVITEVSDTIRRVLDAAGT